MKYRVHLANNSDSLLSHLYLTLSLIIVAYFFTLNFFTLKFSRKFEKFENEFRANFLAILAMHSNFPKIADPTLACN